jgi:hypothetical protein
VAATWLQPPLDAVAVAVMAPQEQDRTAALSAAKDPQTMFSRHTLSLNIHDLGELHDVEYFWRDCQPWLDGLGYTVRPRYCPGWKASWLELDAKETQFWRTEDGEILRVRILIFAPMSLP